jgi:hypothetical protein
VSRFIQQIGLNESFVDITQCSKARLVSLSSDKLEKCSGLYLDERHFRMRGEWKVGRDFGVVVWFATFHQINNGSKIHKTNLIL